MTQLSCRQMGENGTADNMTVAATRGHASLFRGVAHSVFMCVRLCCVVTHSCLQEPHPARLCMSLRRLICSPAPRAHAHGDGGGGGIFDCLNRRLHLRCQMYAQRALISHIEPRPTIRPAAHLWGIRGGGRGGRWKICQLPLVRHRLKSVPASRGGALS